MSTPFKSLTSLLICALLTGCSQLQTILIGNDEPARSPTSVKCPAPEDVAEGESRAQIAYLRQVERWRGKTILRPAPDIGPVLQRKVNVIYAHAQQYYPCLEGAMEWLLVFSNDGTVAEAHLLWRSAALFPLEFELHRALMDFRLLPIAAPPGSVYLLPVTFTADGVNSPRITSRSYMLQ